MDAACGYPAVYRPGSLAGPRDQTRGRRRPGGGREYPGAAKPLGYYATELRNTLADWCAPQVMIGL